MEYFHLFSNAIACDLIFMPPQVKGAYFQSVKFLPAEVINPMYVDITSQIKQGLIAFWFASIVISDCICQAGKGRPRSTIVYTRRWNNKSQYQNW